MFITRQSNIPIGLDISQGAIRLIQLKKGRNKIKIQALNKVNLPEGAMKNGEILNKKLFLTALKEVFSNPKFGNITTNEIIACLPESKSYVELIKIGKSSNKLSDLIEDEIEKNIPISINDMFYDWQEIKSIQEKNSHHDVLIGAAPKTIVNQYISAFNMANLSVLGLETESTAICRALLTEESPKTKDNQFKNFAIINITENSTNLIIYSKNSIVLSISIPISGNEITDQISKDLEINQDQAEKAKIICGFDDKIAKGIIKKILADSTKKLNERIKSGIEFYYSHFPERGPINEILLTGTEVNIKNIAEIINIATSIKTTKGDVFVHIDQKLSDKFSKSLIKTYNLKTNSIKKIKTAELSIKQDTSSEYATAIGLALRGIFLNNN